MSDSNKPVYKKNDVVVFLNTRTVRAGEKAGSTFETFTYQRGEGPSAYRIDVPVSCAGVNLQNNQDKGFSDVVDLVEHGQIIADAHSERTDHDYTLIIAALPPRERPGEKTTFRNLPLVAAFAEYPKEGTEEQKKKVRAFTIASLGEDGKETKVKDLKSYRFIKWAEGKPWPEITVGDMVAGRDAIAKGQPYSFTTRDGFEITLLGIKSVPTEKNPSLKVMEWGVKLVDQTQAASAPLLPTAKAPSEAAKAR